jgi:hypothetical protein
LIQIIALSSFLSPTPSARGTSAYLSAEASMGLFVIVLSGHRQSCQFAIIVTVPVFFPKRRNLPHFRTSVSN